MGHTALSPLALSSSRRGPSLAHRNQPLEVFSGPDYNRLAHAHALALLRSLFSSNPFSLFFARMAWLTLLIVPLSLRAIVRLRPITLNPWDSVHSSDVKRGDCRDHLQSLQRLCLWACTVYAGTVYPIPPHPPSSYDSTQFPSSSVRSKSTSPIATTRLKRRRSNNNAIPKCCSGPPTRNPSSERQPPSTHIQLSIDVNCPA